MGREEVMMLLKRANECLMEAHGLYNLQFYNGTINRAYYGIFNALQAVLQFKDVMVKTHRGAHIEFSRLYIKTGIFSSEIGAIPQQIEDLRIKGDYEPDHELYKADAEQVIGYAQKFYDEIKKYLDANA